MQKSMHLPAQTLSKGVRAQGYVGSNKVTCVSVISIKEGLNHPPPVSGLLYYNCVGT